MLQETQAMFQRLFKLKVLRDLKFFLELEIARSFKGISLSQYVLQLLLNIGFTTAKPVMLHMNPNLKHNTVDGNLLTDVSQYRRLTDCLLY